MSLGEYLKKKHNFGNKDVVLDFCEKFGYTEKMVNKMIADEYPILLTTQTNDFALYTGEDPDFLWSLNVQKE